MEKIVESFELYGKQYRFETGELAKQATGAVLVTQGDTTILVTAVVSKQEKDYDFFPLTVDYIEKMYAVGRIPGGYLKREAKPSDHGTLVARMVDRPIRPGFPDGYKNEVHIVATPFVIDGENLPDTICVAGASAALLVGGAPFDGPAACVRIGRDIETGEFIVNPTNSEQENSDLELTIAGTADYISMVEAGAAEISEEEIRETAADIANRPEFYEKLYPLVAERETRLVDAADKLAYMFWGPRVEVLDEKSVKKVLLKEGARADEALAACRAILADESRAWEAGTLETACRELGEEDALNMKLKLVLQPLRVAVCGNMVSPPLFESIELLPREDVIARIDQVTAEVFGGNE